ncbi:MAG: glycosyltransferase [Rhodanobacter sp.]
MDSQPRRPRIVLATFGTHGDLHPFLALALALRQRGADPVLAAGEGFRDKVVAEGIDFFPMRPDVEAVAGRLALAPQQLARAVAARPQFLLQRIILPSLHEAYDDALMALAGADLVVTHSVAYGARLAAEKCGLPQVGIVLQPMLFASVYDPPVVADMPRLSRWIYRRGPAWTRAFVRLGRRVARRWARPIDRFRRQVGLPPASAHPLFEGQFGSAGAIGLYSPLLGPAQADHPPHTTIAGFAFYDSEKGGPPTLSSALQAFLDAGAPPVVFTQGTSAIHDADDFIRESLAAIDLLGLRAVLVLDDERARRWSSRGSGTIHVTGYAPYSVLFPRASVIVHHGGIGTTAQALRAGRPQLVTPYLVDQPDNAARVVRLGVGRELPRRRWLRAGIAAELRALLHAPGYASAAARVGRQIAREDGAAVAADTIVSALAQRRA